MLRIIWLFGLLLPLGVFADSTITLSGRVYDEAENPIAGVTVILSGAATGQAVTDVEGKFVFSFPEGRIHLAFSADHFLSLESNLVVNESTSMDFTLRSMNPAETMIVTASRVNTSILESPSTGSVLRGETIESSPAQNYADLLRSLPGVNASQISARVFRVTTRQVASAGRIPTELVLADGRSMNIDLNGAASWDTIPIDPSQIEKIEVIHGPASAVWGPSAQTGVINIIEKKPEELAGTLVTLSAGFFDRDVQDASENAGHLFSTNFVRGQILNHRLAMKISGGFFDQSAFARPTGNVPVEPDRNTGGGLYPAYDNLGTTQPKFDFRLDQQLESEGRLSYSGGVAWTEGSGHSSAGPVVIGSGTYNGYAKVAYERQNLFARFLTNRVHIPTSFVFVRNDAGELVDNQYDQQDYSLEAGNSILLGGNHLVSFGGVLRFASFDLTLAPGEDRRDQVGAYIQDEFALGSFRFVIGARIDKFNVTNTIFSPRIAAIYQPLQNQSFRVSYGKAFRPPTLLESYQNLFVTTSALDLGQFDPDFVGVRFPIITQFSGNPELQEETTTALEAGYTGVFGEKTTVSAAFYVNKNDHNIRNSTAELYSAAHTPENWPLSPEIFDLLASRGVLLPSLLQFVNSGPIRYHGLELSLEHRYSSEISLFANYSYQSDPVSLEAANRFPVEQLYEPPNHRFNAGADFLFRSYFANANVQFVSAAFWTDVLSSSFWGPTEAFTMVNASIGKKWNDGRIITSINVTNLFNKEIQQHVFGDIIKRTVALELRYSF